MVSGDPWLKEKKKKKLPPSGQPFRADEHKMKEGDRAACDGEGASDSSPTESLCTPRTKYCQLQAATLLPHTAGWMKQKDGRKRANETTVCPIRSQLPANDLSEGRKEGCGEGLSV